MYTKCTAALFSRPVISVLDSGGMWEDQEEEEEDDEDDELEGQLLSDLISSNKYGEYRLV